MKAQRPIVDQVQSKAADCNQLLNEAITKLGLKNDAALAARLCVAPPIICKLRKGDLAFGPSLILRLHEEIGMSIRYIKHYLRLPSLPLLTKDNNDTPSLPALDEFYGIGRQEVSRNVKYAQWRVTLQRQGEAFRKSFRDDVYGDKDKSLEAAKAYRDQIVKNHLPMVKRDWVQIVRASTNASGIPGVIRVDREIRNNNDKPVRRLAWMAYCRTESGKNKQRLFSIRKYGEQRAFELALEARKAFLEDVKGYVLPLK